MAANDEQVTIIVPTLNAEQYIGALIQSIYSQGYRPLEVIIVNGASTDSTVATAKELAGRLNSDSFTIRVLSEDDYGTLHSSPNAKNIGVLKATSRYLLFFDDDFELTDRNLVRLAKGKLEEQDAVGVRVVPRTDTWLEYHVGVDDFVRDYGSNVHIYCGYRREIFDKVKFDPKLNYGEDRDLQTRAGLHSQLADAYCSRHFVHSVKELKDQSYWYGTGFRYYAKKYWRTLGSMNPLFELFWRTTTLSLIAFCLLAVFLSPILTALGILLLGTRFLYLYLRSASRRAWRIVYLLVRETFATSWFVIGILVSLKSTRR